MSRYIQYYVNIIILSPGVDFITGSLLLRTPGLHVLLPGQPLEVSEYDGGSLGNRARVAQVQLPAVGEGVLRQSLLFHVAAFHYREVGVHPVGEYRSFRHGLDVKIHYTRSESFDDETRTARFLTVGAHEHPWHADDGSVLLVLMLIHTYIHTYIHT